jgi:hypothetical protein
VPIGPKKFFFTKCEYGYQNNAEFYADFETDEKCEKFAQIVKGKKVCKIGVCPLLYGTFNLQKFLANNFSWGHLFSIISTD